jgi:hypothetical protein
MRCTAAQAIDFLEFVLHIPLQGTQWRAAPSRFRLLYNGSVIFGVAYRQAVPSRERTLSFHIAVSAFSQQPR